MNKPRNGIRPERKGWDIVQLPNGDFVWIVLKSSDKVRKS